MIDEELEKLRQSRRRPRELERAVNQIEASFYARMERVGRLRRQGRSAERLLHRRPATRTTSPRTSRATARCRRPTSRPPCARFLPRRSARRAASWCRRRRAVACHAHRRFASHALRPSPADLALAAPASRAGRPIASRPRALGPPPGADAAGDPEARRSSNGLPVWIVELHEVPVVQVNLVVLTGAGADPAGKFGAGEPDGGDARRRRRHAVGARDRRRDRLPRRVADDGQLVRRVGRPPVGAGGAARRRAADAWPTSRCGRRFPQTELERLRKERLTALLQARDDAAVDCAAWRSRGSCSARRIATARRRVGDARHASSASRSTTCARFYAAYYRPDNATLIVVGDVDGRRVLPLLEAAFGAWKPEGPAAGPHRARRRPAARRGRCTSSTSPAPPQSQIRIGGVGVPRSTPDYFPLAGAEHDPRRVVHVAAQPEPARAARLHLRRRLVRSTCGGRPGRSWPRPACRPTRPPRR